MQSDSPIKLTWNSEAPTTTVHYEKAYGFYCETIVKNIDFPFARNEKHNPFINEVNK